MRKIINISLHPRFALSYQGEQVAGISTDMRQFARLSVRTANLFSEVSHIEAKDHTTQTVENLIRSHLPEEAKTGLTITDEKGGKRLFYLYITLPGVDNAMSIYITEQVGKDEP